MLAHVVKQDHSRTSRVELLATDASGNRLLSDPLVCRLMDADLILAADGEALNTALVGAWGAAAGHNEQSRALHLEQFIRTLEVLVANGDLVAAEVLPALTEAQRAFGTS